MGNANARIFAMPSVLSIARFYWVQRDADGSVAAGVAALSAFETEFSPDIIRRYSCEVRQAPLVILDGNLSTEVLQVMKVVLLQSCTKAELCSMQRETNKSSSSYEGSSLCLQLMMDRRAWSESVFSCMQFSGKLKQSLMRCKLQDLLNADTLTD